MIDENNQGIDKPFALWVFLIYIVLTAGCVYIAQKLINL